MAELVAELARRLVDEPAAVRVEEVEEPDGTLLLRLHVAEGDVGADAEVGAAEARVECLEAVEAARGQGQAGAAAREFLGQRGADAGAGAGDRHDHPPDFTSHSRSISDAGAGGASAIGARRAGPMIGQP